MHPVSPWERWVSPSPSSHLSTEMKLGRFPAEGSRRSRRYRWRAALAVLGVLAGSQSNRDALAEDTVPVAAQPDHPVRSLCKRPPPSAARDDAPAASCHMLPFPAFVPSALAVTYVGVRIGGGY